MSHPACIAVLLLTAAARGTVPLFDPALDDPSKEWCYAAQSTTVIGLPFVGEPVQITYDGAVYTGHAELAFFYGSPLQPVMARQKSFRDGWIPIIEYEWSHDGIAYRLEIVSAELPELGRANLVQLARLEMHNPGATPRGGTIAAGIRGTAGHFRKGASRDPVGPATRFEFHEHRLIRNGKTVGFFPPGGELQAVADIPYTAPFLARDHHVTDRTITGLRVLHRTLKPGESSSAVFKLPRVPLTNTTQIAAVAAADYHATLERTVRWWEHQFGDPLFEIPEKRVKDSYRASMVHLMLATRDADQHGPRQGSGLPYDALFLNDYMDMLLAYSAAGMGEYIGPNVGWLLAKQHASGMFIDVHNRGDDNIVTSHGQGLFALAYPLVVTRDREYGNLVYDAIRRGAAFIVRDHRTHNPYGLIRPSIPYDAPMVDGYHTCHNLFALLALRTSIRAAHLMGETDDATAWTAAEASYRQAILRAIEHVNQRQGYIRSGLYDWRAGWVQGREGWINDYPNQDWENNLLVYPTELLAPDDPRVAGTLSEIRRRKYREGVMTYRNGMHVHQYVTLNQAQQYRAIGDQQHALRDLYHVLLHNGPTHEGFENLVVPWSNRTPADRAGIDHRFAPIQARHVRVNMLYHNLNKGVHLVEIQVHGPTPGT